MSAANTLNQLCEIQSKNLEHSYFCRDMFRHFDSIDAPESARQETIKDFLSVADGIIVIGNTTNEMDFVLDFAKEINMEVEYIKNA